MLHLAVVTLLPVAPLLPFASYLEVPEAHLKARALPALESASAQTQQDRIHSGKDKPADAFAAVY